MSKRLRLSLKQHKPADAATAVAVTDVYIPDEVIALIFNAVALEEVGTRFALLQCSKKMATLMMPSILATVQWISDTFGSQQRFYETHGRLPSNTMTPIGIHQSTGSMFMVRVLKFFNYTYAGGIALFDVMERATPKALKSQWIHSLSFFRCLDYISAYYTHACPIDIADGTATKYSGRTVVLPASRVRNIYYRCGGGMVTPLSECTIQVVADLPDGKKAQMDAIEDAIKQEKDCRQRELMQVYDEKYGTSPEKLRAKCFLLGEKNWLVRAPKPNDLFEDVIVTHGDHHHQHHHIFHDRVKDFRNRCFVHVGRRADVELGARLYKSRSTACDLLGQRLRDCFPEAQLAFGTVERSWFNSAQIVAGKVVFTRLLHVSTKG